MTTLADASQNWVLEWWPVISFITPVLIGLFAWVARREMKRWKKDTAEQVEAQAAKVAEQVIARTREIQPDKNGGRSLADANGKLDLLPGQLEALSQQVATLQGGLADTAKRLDSRLGKIDDRLAGVEGNLTKHLLQH